MASCVALAPSSDAALRQTIGLAATWPSEFHAFKSSDRVSIRSAITSYNNRPALCNDGRP